MFANLQSLTAFFISVGTTFWNFGIAGYGLPLKTITKAIEIDAAIHYDDY